MLTDFIFKYSLLCSSTRPLFTASSGSPSNEKEESQTGSRNDNRLWMLAEAQESLQEVTTDHYQFDCEALAQVRFSFGVKGRLFFSKKTCLVVS